MNLQKIWTTPFLSIEDIAEETGLPHTSMRNWVDRGKVELLYSYRPGSGGKGVKALYSLRDAVQFILVAQLKKINSDCKFDEEQSSYIFGIIQGYTQGEYNNADSNTDRFLYIYFDGVQIRCDSTSSSDLVYERNREVKAGGPLQISGDTWTVIDAKTFAERMLSFFEKHKSKLV